MAWLPKWLACRINPIPYLIENFITTAAKKHLLAPGYLMLLLESAGTLPYFPNVCTYQLTLQRGILRGNTSTSP